MIISMITVKEKTTLASISELRTKTEEILEHLKENRVVLERHQKPVAVMLDYEKYELTEKMIEFAEDYILGMIALERDEESKAADFVDIDKW